MSDPCFISFQQSLTGLPLPERFTFPFYYQPHPLCLVASEELQKKLMADSVHYDFAENGKMLGVLLVENKQGEVGYLTAFSGKLTVKSKRENKESKADEALTNFVPFVFDSEAQGSYFQQEQTSINALNALLKSLESNPTLLQEQEELAELLSSSAQEISQRQSQLSEERKARKLQRAQAQHSLNATEVIALQDRLAKESISDKNSLKYLKLAWQQKIEESQQQVNHKLNEIEQMKKERKSRSVALQQYLFQQYQFLNIQGEQKNLTELFQNTSFHQRYGVPPAGSGDCAAPKLLQYAFKHGFKPLALAEFWWGKSPKSAIRQHKNFYTACIGKCQPILTHMLFGMLLDKDPLIESNIAEDALDFVYQDDDIAVVNKPSGLLSVPGKTINDSVYTRMKAFFPQATGPLIVHRLDMSTSGLMVIALNKEVNKNLQKQFIKRTVKKIYVALLEGDISSIKAGTEKEGDIDLPLVVDFDDRPRQMVCFDTGKTAQTHWQFIAPAAEQQANTSRVHLYPKTGRTHQLRVHCAHVSGLNMPIVGDDLYGTTANRLHLHAELLVLKHPVTQQLMTFEVKADF